MIIFQLKVVIHLEKEKMEKNLKIQKKVKKFLNCEPS